MNTDQFQDVRFDIFKQYEPVIRAASETNEATTRLRAIDVILFDVLGWDRRSVDPELYCRDTGFADYAFKQGDSLCLILEAKKSDATFVIANQSYGKRAVGFSLIATQCPDAAKALEQAAGYAFSKGTRYVAITNGHQWLLALTFVQDQPFDQRSVIVFESTDAIISRFSDFFDCFSPAALYANLPASRLLESRKAPAPEKLARRNPNYPEPANRNAIVDELSVVVDLVWDEMLTEERTERFLRECYVRPDASGDGIAQAKTVLEQHRRTDELAAQPPANIDRTTSLLKEGKNEEKPIVVLGRIGHGKSTFLHYLRSVEAQTVLQKYIQIDINFLDRPDRDEEVASFVFAEIETQLLGRYGIDITEDGFVRGVFDSDLVRFRKSPVGKAFATNEAEYRIKELEHITALQGELHSFYAKIFHHLRCGRGYSVALFFDNLDRRPDSFQEQAFLKASAMARDWDCLVFVCLRHGTYSRSKSDGVLDTIAPKSFVVTAPNTSALLKRRFRFCRELVSGDSDASYGQIVGNNVTLDLPKTARFLECCEESFARNRELVRLFEAVSNGTASAHSWVV